MGIERSWRIIFQFIWFFMTLSIIGSQEYIWLNVHSSGNCSMESIIIQWLIPTSSNCTKLYDLSNDKWMSLSYNFSESTVNCSTFNDLESCNHQIQPYSSATFGIGSCSSFNISTESSKYFVNFTITNDRPFQNTSDMTLGFFVLHSFKDENCGVPFHSLTKTDIIVRAPMLEDSKQLPPYFCSLNGSGFKNEDYFVYQNEHYGGYVDGEKVFLPRTKANQCSQNNGINTAFTELVNNRIKCSDIPVKSFILKCLSYESIQSEYLNTIPTISDTKFVFDYLHYDSNCSLDSYLRSPQAVDLCLENNRIIRTSETMFVELLFSTSDCSVSSSPYAYFIHQSTISLPLYGRCEYVCTVDKGKISYSTYSKSNDPFYPSYMTLIVIPSDVVPPNECKSYDLSYALANPATSWTFYAEESFCFWGSWLGWVGSFRGKCEKGKLRIKWYFEFKDCDGVYRIVENEENKVCFRENSYVSFFTCSPRKCNGYDENDPLVCNKRGICTSYDECMCESGYSGNDCDDWNCFGVNKEEHEKVCYGNGKCKSPDECDCNRMYSGKECENDLYLSFIVIPISSIFLASLCCLIFISLAFLICCICFLFCGIVIVILGLSSSLKKLQTRVNRFSKLQNFDIFLKEQELEESQDIANLRIDKSLFTIPFEEIKISERLGEGGSSSHVYKAQWKGSVIAFKQYKTRSLYGSQVNFDEFEREVQILASISHPFVLNFVGCSLKPPRVGIVMEYCENGDMSQFLKSRRHVENEDGTFGYPIDEKYRLCKEVISAMDFVHSRNIIHRDLKLENVLISDNEHCKLMDFGLSKIVDSMNSSSGKLTKRIGTNIYMAPELIKESSDGYNSKCDVFSFAIMLHLIFSENFFPYGRMCHGIELQVANNPKLRPHLREISGFLGDGEYSFIMELLPKMWSAEPSERPSFHSLVRMFKEKKFISEEVEVEEEKKKEKEIVSEIEELKKERGRLGGGKDEESKKTEKKFQKKLEHFVFVKLKEKLSMFPSDEIMLNSYLESISDSVDIDMDEDSEDESDDDSSDSNSDSDSSDS